ncbi:hypothetical protein JA1_001314 [Spathaspora sp. JA1]|nr:hypothetical protein JA1_001314 [Spathaspora sp. JA1]
MSSDWAAKLANVSKSKSPPVTTPTVNERKNSNVKNKKSTPTPKASPEIESNFNSSEILQYLNTNYSKYVQLAKQDKEGDQIKIYRSLESSSQWTTQTKPSTTTGGSSKYNAKDVIRNKNGSTNNNTLDLLFEINRSIYQQKESR